MPSDVLGVFGDWVDSRGRQPLPNALLRAGIPEREPSIQLLCVPGQNSFELAEGAATSNRILQLTLEVLAGDSLRECLHVLMALTRVGRWHFDESPSEALLYDVCLGDRLPHPGRQLALRNRARECTWVQCAAKRAAWQRLVDCLQLTADLRGDGD